MDDGADRSALGQDRRHHLEEGIVDEERDSTTVVERVDIFGDRPANIERDENGANPGHGGEIFEVAVGIERQNSDTVARCDAEGFESAGKPRHAVLELSPALRACSEGRGTAVAVLLNIAPDALRDRHDSSLAIFSTACSFYRR